MRRALLLLLCVLTPLPGWAGTFFVRQDGDNTKCSGTAPAATQRGPCAWRTLQHAVLKARPGDTITLGAGRFVERLTLRRGGTLGKPLVVQGTRSKDGGYETVLDGSTAVSAEWQAVGDGSYKAQLGYTPYSMTSKGLAIWRVGNHAWEEGPRAPGVFGIPPDEDASTALGPVKFWDGISALFGVNGGWTHLRFRNKEHPKDMQVRAAPAGAVVTISTNNVTIEGVKIVGGQYAVKVTAGAQNAVIQDNYLSHGKHRIVVEGNASGTVIQRNLLTYDGIGFADPNLPAGDWSSVSYARKVNRHRYDENKFLIGDTETDDSQIELIHDNGTKIFQNVLRDSNAGITFHGTTHDADIAGNQIYRHADNCVYINSDFSSVQFHHNLVYDCDHLMRFQSTQNNLQWAVYANSFWQPEGTGKHLFFNPPSWQPGDSTVAVYQNSHAGTGWAVDVGSDGEHVELPFVFVENLLNSVDDLSSWGDVRWGSKKNIYRDTLWYKKPLPDFTLPSGSGAVNSAPALSAPGMTQAYYVDNQPDHGSTQAGQGIVPPEPPQPPATDTTPPTVQLTAPQAGDVMRGTVDLVATAGDDRQVAGVQFAVRGHPVGGEQCCVSVEYRLDTRGFANGPAQVTAAVRDSAGNETLSAPVAVTIQNGTTPPDPPEPPATGALACTGTMASVPGSVAMTCVPVAQP